MRRLVEYVRLALVVATLALLGSCDRNEDVLSNPYPDYISISGVGHDMIELGDRLDDPYTVENMTEALRRVYPTRSDIALLKPTDIYVRFLPQSEEQFQTLRSFWPVLMDHPLDYQIVKEGDYYHDPALPGDSFTWQYAVIPSDMELPKGIRCEILDRCYIPEGVKTSRAGSGQYDDVDWDEVVQKSFILTGNGAMLGESGPLTRAQGGGPCGRIALLDEHHNEGHPSGVSGVKVCANVFVNACICSTDDEGYYEMDRKFSSNPRYRLIFSNDEGFSIGLDRIVIPASVSTLGRGSADGVSVLIDKDCDKKLYYRSVVNNAACSYYRFCRMSGVTPPPKDMRIWLLQSLPASSACMLHHGALLNNELLEKFFGDILPVFQILMPDVTIGLSRVEDYYQAFSLTVHEFAHASHFSTVGTSYWDRYIEFIIRSFVTSGWKTYGNGDEKDAGYCEVGEMWAYHVENELHHDRYPGHVWTSGYSMWFKPQILDALSDRGLPTPKIFKALGPEQTDLDKLKSRLLALYPEYRSDINEVFKRYSL